MSLLELLQSHITPGALAQSCHSWSTCPVVSLLELYPRQVTPGSLYLSCHSWRSCRVVSLLEILPSRVTPGAPTGEFQISSGVFLLPSRFTPEAFEQSGHSWRFVQSCHTWNSCQRISGFQRRNALTQLCHSWISCPVMSLPELLPSSVAPGSLAHSCHTRSSCRFVSLLELQLGNFQVPAAYGFRPTRSILSSCPVMLHLQLLPIHVAT